MIFRKRKSTETVDEEADLLLFQGALSGKEVDLAANPRLTEVGLTPTKELLTDALTRRAELLRIEPKGDRARVMLQVDGINYPGGQLPKQQAMAITQMVKLLSGLNIKERRKPQAGGMKAEFQETPFEFRVESVPVAGGAERLVVRARNLKQKLDTPEDLGFSNELKDKIREMSSHHRGAMLVCGPPRSGTTTTSFAVLRAIDCYVYSIFTIADVENRSLTNITPFEENEGDSLSQSLDRCIRVDADVIFLDPIRDAEVAQLIFSKCEKVTFTAEFTAKDVAQGVAQLIQWTGDAEAVADGLHGLISQKLIRRLCKKCREAYRPNTKMIAKMGLPPETKTLYRKPREPMEGEPPREPCDRCGGLGYFGRIAMIELLEMTDAMRQLVREKPSVDQIKQLIRKEKMQTFQRDGLRLVAEGVTSLEELQRAFKGSK